MVEIPAALVLRAPLRPYPMRGALVGAVVGAVMFLMVRLQGLGIGEASVALGAFGCCITGGAIIGGLLPLMKWRWMSGVVVTIAGSCGMFIAFRCWRQEVTSGNTIFLGFTYGFTYAALFWRYEQ